MYQIVLFVHVIVAMVLIGLVLIQQGKGATMGAAFGSGASSTVFGSQGSGSFLLKLTSTLAAVFFATSISLGYIASSAYKQSQGLQIPAGQTQQQKQVDQTPVPVKEAPAKK